MPFLSFVFVITYKEQSPHCIPAICALLIDVEHKSTRFAEEVKIIQILQEL